MTDYGIENYIKSASSFSKLMLSLAHPSKTSNIRKWALSQEQFKRVLAWPLSSRPRGRSARLQRYLVAMVSMMAKSFFMRSRC